MNKKAAISFVVLMVSGFFLALSAYCTGDIKDYKVPSRFPDDLPPTKLSVYLPEGYDTSGAHYPVLYLIHGDRGNNLTFLGGGYGGVMSDANVSVIVDRLVQEGKIRQLLVACPDMGSAGLFDEDLLRDVVTFVDANFRTIPDRESRAIAGHSAGGTRSLYMTLRHPEVFSVAGGFASHVNAARLGGLAKAHNQKSYPIRFWLYEGTKDQAGFTQPNRDLSKALTDSGLPTEYVEDDGDHDNKVAQRLSEFVEFVSKYLKR